MFFGLDCEDISALINKEFFSIFWEKKNTKNKTERYQEELFGRFVDKSYTDYKTCKYTASEVTPPQHTMCGKPSQTHCFPTEPVLKQRQKVHRMRESSESEWRAHLPVKKTCYMWSLTTQPYVRGKRLATFLLWEHFIHLTSPFPSVIQSTVIT